MPKRLTYEFVKEQFEKEGYILVSEKYINNHQKLNYICPNNHKGSIRYNDFQFKKRCAECVGCKRYNITEIKQKVKKLIEGYKCLSNKYKNNKEKLKFICNYNHTFYMTWHDFQKGARCPKCWRIRNSKERSHLWNPNLTEEDRQQTRKFPKYIEWRNEVYKKDNYICQKCNQYGGDLNAHHIESYNNNIELRIEISNGITFCIDCHKNFHHLYGYGNNTQNQLEEFLCQ